MQIKFTLEVTTATGELVNYRELVDLNDGTTDAEITALYNVWCDEYLAPADQTWPACTHVEGWSL